MQFGKIFNNNNATNDDSKIKNFNNIDDLFANTLIPIEQKAIYIYILHILTKIY